MGRKPLPTSDMLESDEDFGAAYESFAGPIYRFFYWRTRDRELAEDLTGTVFEKAWRSRKNFTGGSISGWLHRIARNLLVDHWRAKKPVPLADESELPCQEDEALAERLDRKLALERLRLVLDQLPDPMQAVVRLRFLQGQSVRQVARSLGLTESNVRVLQYRALKKIRNDLDA